MAYVDVNTWRKALILFMSRSFNIIQFMERDALNYFFLIITIFITAYFVVKYALYFLKFLRFGRIEAEIIKLKIDKSSHFYGKYSFVVRYHIDGETFESSLHGYSTPFAFNLQEKIRIRFNRKNPAEIIPGNLKGQKIAVFVRIVVIILLLVSIFYCLQLVDVVNVFGNRTPIVISGIFLFMAFIMSLHSLCTRFALIKKMSSTTGIIKDLVQVLDNERETAYKPIVEFIYNDAVFRFESEAFFYNTSKLGADVKVMYFVDHPELAEIDSFEYSWLEILFWLFLFLISCIALYVTL